MTGLTTCQLFACTVNAPPNEGVAGGRSPQRSARNSNTSWGSELPGILDDLYRASPLNAKTLGSEPKRAAEPKLPQASC